MSNGSHEAVDTFTKNYSKFWEGVFWRKPHFELRQRLVVDPEAVIAEQAVKMASFPPEESVSVIEERLRGDLLDQLDWQIHRRQAAVRELQDKLAAEQAQLDDVIAIKANLLKEE